MSAALLSSTPALRGNCIPDHARKRALFRPCYLPSAHGVPSLQRQHHKRCRQRKSTRRCSAHAASATAPVDASSSILDSATTLVDIIESERNTIRSHNLGSASTVAINRLTMLCILKSQGAALIALAKNGSSSKEGSFLLLVQLLFGPQNSSSPGVAADFLQAFLTGPNGCVRRVDDMHSNPEWRILAAQLSSVTPWQLLKLIIGTPDLKVKTAALMVLTLKAASSKDDLAAVARAGAVLILSDEMLQLASHDYQAHSKNREADGNKQQQGLESGPFLQSAQHLLEQINLSATGLGWKANGLRHLALVACHATASCTLPPAVPAQSLLQRLFAHIHTLIRNIIATCFLVKTFVGAVLHQGNILAAKEQQAHRIGEWLLGIQNSSAAANATRQLGVPGQCCINNSSVGAQVQQGRTKGSQA